MEKSFSFSTLDGSTYDIHLPLQAEEKKKLQQIPTDKLTHLLNAILDDTDLIADDRASLLSGVVHLIPGEAMESIRSAFESSKPIDWTPAMITVACADRRAANVSGSIVKQMSYLNNELRRAVKFAPWRQFSDCANVLHAMLDASSRQQDYTETLSELTSKDLVALLVTGDPARTLRLLCLYDEPQITELDFSINLMKALKQMGPKATGDLLQQLKASGKTESLPWKIQEQLLNLAAKHNLMDEHAWIIPSIHTTPLRNHLATYDTVTPQLGQLALHVTDEQRRWCVLPFCYGLRGLLIKPEVNILHEPKPWEALLDTIFQHGGGLDSLIDAGAKPSDLAMVLAIFGTETPAKEFADLVTKLPVDLVTGVLLPNEPHRSDEIVKALTDTQREQLSRQLSTINPTALTGIHWHVFKERLASELAELEKQMQPLMGKMEKMAKGNIRPPEMEHLCKEYDSQLQLLRDKATALEGLTKHAPKGTNLASALAHLHSLPERLSAQMTAVQQVFQQQRSQTRKANELLDRAEGSKGKLHADDVVGGGTTEEQLREVDALARELRIPTSGLNEQQQADIKAAFQLTEKMRAELLDREKAKLASKPPHIQEAYRVANMPATKTLYPELLGLKDDATMQEAWETYDKSIAKVVGGETSSAPDLSSEDRAAILEAKSRLTAALVYWQCRRIDTLWKTRGTELTSEDLLGTKDKEEGKRIHKRMILLMHPDKVGGVGIPLKDVNTAVRIVTDNFVQLRRFAKLENFPD